MQLRASTIIFMQISDFTKIEERKKPKCVFLLRGARKGSTLRDVTHGRVVPACCKPSPNIKYLFVLKQDMSNGDGQRHEVTHRHNINLSGEGSVSSFIMQDCFDRNKG